MKSFLEEYGFAILAAIVVIVLILMISPVGGAVRKSVVGVVADFSATTQTATASASEKLTTLYEEIDEGSSGAPVRSGPKTMVPLPQEGGDVEVYDNETIHIYDSKMAYFNGELGNTLAWWVIDGKGNIVDTNTDAWTVAAKESYLAVENMGVSALNTQMLNWLEPEVDGNVYNYEPIFQQTNLKPGGGLKLINGLGN